MSGPTREQAFEAFCVLLAFANAQTCAPAIYTADALPPDATSRDAFLRIHRRHLKARTPGWTKRGKTRAVTRAAWELDTSEETGNAGRSSHLRAVAMPADDRDDIDRALGIRIRKPR